jgi:hypothetical protein
LHMDEKRKKTWKQRSDTDEPPIILDAIKREHLVVFFEEDKGMIEGLIRNLTRDIYEKSAKHNFAPVSVGGRVKG